MTHSILRISAITAGTAAFVALASLSPARADTSSNPAPSLSEPAPTPGWAEAGPASPRSSATAVPHVRQHASRARRHYAEYGDNPVRAAAMGVAGGVADAGSLAAYPIYCFPNYGSCPVHWYRF